MSEEIKRYRFKGAAGEYVYANDFEAAQSELAALRNELGEAKGEYDRSANKVAALREELAEAGRYKNLYEQSEKTLDRVHCMYAKRLLEATGERQTVLIPDEEFVKYFEEIKELKQRLTAAEQRNAELVELLNGYPRGVPGFATWADKVTVALKPTESGASE